MHPIPTIKPISATETYDLRHTILWPEKPIAYVQIPEDADGHHFGAFVNDELVSVISLFINNQKHEARFRKFATAEAWQGKGIGSVLLKHVMDVARETEGVTSIWCDSRSRALSFYQRFGMKALGEAFYKGDIEYMRLRGRL